MIDETKAVFNDPQLLRQKLSEYFNTINLAKVECYALAAEKFFSAGGRESLQYKATWSWIAFFFSEWFFIYKKEYLKGILLLIVVNVGYIIDFLIPNPNISDQIFEHILIPWLLVLLIISIVSGMYAKYIVIKRFEFALNTNEIMFRQMSGENTWAIWACILVYFIDFLVSIFGI